MAEVDPTPINETYRAAIAAGRDLIQAMKNWEGVIQNDGQLGDAAAADTLSEIAAGDAAAVRESLAINGYTYYLSLPNSDLNKVLAQGTYSVAYGDNAVNTPKRFNAGVLEVYYSGGQYVQIMISRGEALIAIRGTSNGTSWSRWKDFVLGGVSYTKLDDPFWGDQRTSINEYNNNGSTQNTPLWKNLNFQWAQIIALGRSDNRAAFLAATSLGSKPRLSVGILNSDVVGDGTGDEIPDDAYVWGEVWQTQNSTVDSNGFIKKASPIFRLANTADSAMGDSFSADGCGAFNSEAKGVTASHDDVGVYTVSGSLGFAAEGWTIEIPQDVNGNRLCFVETETADDGTITVRTFGRRFDYEAAMIVAGDPIDIPDGRWIDLRLKMPEPEVVDEPDDSTEQEPAQ